MLPRDADSDYSSDSNYSHQAGDNPLLSDLAKVANQLFEELGRCVNDDGLSETEATEAQLQEEEELFLADSSNLLSGGGDAPLDALHKAITMLDASAQNDMEFNSTFLDREEDIVDELNDEIRRDFVGNAPVRAASPSAINWLTQRGNARRLHALPQSAS